MFRAKRGRWATNWTFSGPSGSVRRSPTEVPMQTHVPQPPPADRRRLKTETSASNGWAARLQALMNVRDMQRPPQPKAPGPTAR